MTNPPNSEQTARIAEKNGVLTASLQVGKFPPNEVTGILKDGDLRVLTTTRSGERRSDLRGGGVETGRGQNEPGADAGEQSDDKRGTGTKQPKTAR
jgi:hypothetical protein